jgi:DNA-binding XRE family transcriptional regulator
MLTAVTSLVLLGLRACRLNTGLTQVELARTVGLRSETLCRLEKGRQGAGRLAVKRLAEVLGVTVERLTRGAQQRERDQLQTDGRVCTDCGMAKSIDSFTPIKSTRTGHYGRCRICRNKRARERYRADRADREHQKADASPIE